MKVSESLRKLVDALAPTVGNRLTKKLLLEHVEQVEDLERQNESLRQQVSDYEWRHSQ